jgi:hypothetical protein
MRFVGIETREQHFNFSVILRVILKESFDYLVEILQAREVAVEVVLIELIEGGLAALLRYLLAGEESGFALSGDSRCFSPRCELVPDHLPIGACLLLRLHYPRTATHRKGG